MPAAGGAGLTEHAAGVKVTGGTVSAVSHGMVKLADGSLRIANENTSAIIISDTNDNLGFYGGISSSAKVGCSNRNKLVGFTTVASNKDASEQRIRQAASGYDIWKSNPLNTKGGDPGKRKQIFEINCE